MAACVECVCQSGSLSLHKACRTGDDGQDVDVVNDTRQSSLNTEGLGLGSLDSTCVQQVLELARCLAGSKPEESHLDTPAQRLLTSMQVSSAAWICLM